MTGSRDLYDRLRNPDDYGYMPDPSDLLPPAAHLTVDGDVLAVFTAEVRNMRGECADCRTALTDPAATLCIECQRDRDELAAERNAEWWR